MKMLDVAKIAWRNLFRSGNKRRSFYTLTSIAVSVWCSCFFLFYREGIVQVTELNQIVYDSGVNYVENKDFERLSMNNPLYLRIENTDRVVELIKSLSTGLEVYPRNLYGVRYYREETSRLLFLNVMGIDIEREFPYLMLDDLRGRAPQNDKEIVVSGKIASLYNLNVGDKMTLMTKTMRQTSNAKTFTVVGIARYPSSNSDQNVVMSYESSLSLAKLDGAMRIVVYRGDPRQRKSFGQEDLKKDFNEKAESDDLLKSLVMKAMNDTTYVEYMRVSGKIFFIISLVFVLLGSTVIANTSMMSVFEREREIGALKAIGYFNAEIKRMFFFENLFLGVIGAFTGVFLASLIAYFLRDSGINVSFLTQSGKSPIPLGENVYIRFSGWRALFMFFITVAVNVGVSSIPVRRVTKLLPVVAMKSR